MLLAIDIGNTNISIGLFNNDTIVFEGRLSTDISRTSDQYALEIRGIAELKSISLKDISGAIISSVVPSLTSSIKTAVFQLTGIEAMILGPGVKSGLHIKIDNPAQLGADLVAGAAGAREKYSLPCLVIDLGTATKISVLDSTGAYLGCTISPGVGISLNALSGSAALLPNINISLDNCPAYGTNTVTSMQAGVVLGTAAMLDGLCDRIEKHLGVKMSTIVATGGYAKSIISHCNREVIFDKNLLLDGLRFIYNKNK